MHLLSFWISLYLLYCDNFQGNLRFYYSPMEICCPAPVHQSLKLAVPCFDLNHPSMIFKEISYNCAVLKFSGGCNRSPRAAVSLSNLVCSAAEDHHPLLLLSSEMRLPDKSASGMIVALSFEG